MNERLKAKMEELNVKQVELCEVTGWDPPLMSYLVTRPFVVANRSDLKEVQKKIAKRLKCKVGDIF